MLVNRDHDGIVGDEVDFTADRPMRECLQLGHEDEKLLNSIGHFFGLPGG